jgi:outer membrane protein assembly factor BamB
MISKNKSPHGIKFPGGIAPVLLFSLFLLFSCFSCDLFFGQDKDEEDGPVYPEYKAKVVWRSDTKIVKYRHGVQEGRYLYVYEDVSWKDDNYDFRLKKLDPENGAILWQSPDFPEVRLCAPVIIGDTIYVLVGRSRIYCFDKNTGRQAAIVQTDVHTNKLEMCSNLTAFGNCLYFGIGKEDHGDYFARINVNNISLAHGSQTEQMVEPEILWESAYNRRVLVDPVIWGDNIYFITYTRITRFSVDPSEFVGINTATKEIVWSKETMDDDGRGTLLIHGDIIYVLGKAVIAYDLKTGERLFIRTFPEELLVADNYSPGNGSRGSFYYNDKLYYTNHNYDSLEYNAPNIVCLNAKDGSTVWTDLPYNSNSLGVTPLVYNDRVFLPQDHELRVYNANTGEVIGVDKTLCGSGHNGTIFQYNNLMIFPDSPGFSGIYSYIAIDLNG